MEKDIIVTCPYNKSHRIRRCKLMTHLLKCKKQSGATNKVTCPLNGIHIMDPNDIKDHLTSCSNLSSLVKTNVVKEEIDKESIIKDDTYKSNENWDEAPEVPSYDPWANSASKKVIRCVTGMTKSERIKFRLSERDRIANLNETSTVKQIPLHRETLQEIPLRPPHGVAQVRLSDTNISQQTSNKNAQKQDSVESAQLKSTTTNEFRDTFQKTLFNELLSDHEPDDNLIDNTFSDNESQYVKSKDSAKMDSTLTQNLLELSATNSDTSYKSFNSPGPSTRNWFEDIIGRGKNLSFTGENEKIEVRKEARGRGISRSKMNLKDVTEVDASCQIFGADNSKVIESDKYTEDTYNTSTSDERVTDKLLAILMDKTEKMELTDEKEESNLNSKFGSILYKLNDRLDHLTNIQNATVEQNARLIKEMNDLKQLKTCCNTQSSITLNKRCAANFPEPLSLAYSKNHNMFQGAPSFEKNTPSSTDTSEGNDAFNSKDDSELHKLRTPEDFYHH
ncbi:PREDICTED: uncharacterized protein LOC106743603 [Dinoponera quadriceps]|uniref:Uncharacterized protein LOC106743603 n=1 Tax=Dinoponera quadriceps TaxID=609295 RepID=A0A6P3X5C4_DINQU|nr:PREDICTED: uncharacterized protein LOC106743603 [Dinoponera quadriceps]XP_014473089.1 PREDICTED: uncharacterized protein LOC106743603 [Dinoponera quadriceps]